ncbi:hypothetical protein Ddc_00777 [Ditylenchus destructor]|nr:hypothetical protein Ddc_00777 [Ditylenchus destructor]
MTGRAERILRSARRLDSPLGLIPQSIFGLRYGLWLKMPAAEPPTWLAAASSFEHLPREAVMLLRPR